MSPIERQVAKLAGANGEPASPAELVKKVFPATGEVVPGADKLLDNIHARVSAANWNQYRQAMWQHLLETPEGVTDYGPQKLSQRLAKFLGGIRQGDPASPIAKSLYSDSEIAMMRQYAEHYGKLKPLPNTTNASGSAVMGVKLVRQMKNHISAIIGSQIGGAIGGPFIGHIAGALVGEGVERAASAIRTARQLERTKELFLGKKVKASVNPDYERAAAVLAHAATPLTSNDHARMPPR